VLFPALVVTVFITRSDPAAERIFELDVTRACEVTPDRPKRGCKIDGNCLSSHDVTWLVVLAIRFGDPLVDDDRVPCGPVTVGLCVVTGLWGGNAAKQGDHRARGNKRDAIFAAWGGVPDRRPGTRSSPTIRTDRSHTRRFGRRAVT
jgi:hypothetical protein